MQAEIDIVDVKIVYFNTSMCVCFVSFASNVCGCAVAMCERWCCVILVPGRPIKSDSSTQGPTVLAAGGG